MKRDDAHRQPGQAEADERDGGRLVGLVRAEQRQVRAERRAGQERRDRELADDDREGQEGAAQERDPQVREDDPDEDPGQPAPRLCAASVRLRMSIAWRPVSTARYMYGNDRTT